ncbi:cupin domain-containing protein [Granulicella arctica]|uniref:cupin domain-containing protein n=1 Tax=Granulicella arctica TaxID=940613 RepID=UPI0021E0CD68|nr:cupin domain-containing protein [Granulicella arctica]
MTKPEHTTTAFNRTATLDSTVAYMGSLMTFLAKASETDGRFALMEYYTKPGNEPPPHIHDREHEMYFVLDGSMRFYCEDKTIDIHAGDVVFLPQGKAHAFNCTSAQVRTLILVAASGEGSVGLDNYFQTMGEATRSMSLPEHATTYVEDTPERAIKACHDNGIYVMSEEETRLALPQYPGFGVPVR